MIKKEYLFATNNLNKQKEICNISPPSVKILSFKDVGFSGEIPENGDTLTSNAFQKANYLYKQLGIPCFADDTGLEVDALQGRPGVYSARYAARYYNNPLIAGNTKENIHLLLKELEGKSNRSAQFKTVICLIENDSSILYFEGSAPGSITKKTKGTDGFGYDPIFIPSQHTITFAEMSLQEKNKISHRYKAFSKLIQHLASV